MSDNLKDAIASMLGRTSSPAAQLSAGSDPNGIRSSKAIQLAGYSTLVLDGSELPTSAMLRSRIVSELNFPSHYASNWDAFAECLIEFAEFCASDGFVILVSRPWLMLVNEPRDRSATFLDACDTAAAEWQAGSVNSRPLTFRLVLLVNTKLEDEPWNKLPLVS